MFRCFGPTLAATLLLLPLAWPPVAAGGEISRPNVVLIMTDDQGFGDVGLNGNSMLKTPSLDELGRQSIRLMNFHVDPTCAETRAALMTGRYSARAGVWHTIMGRSILRRDERIMPQYFRDASYATGIFGKWHLGDNYPYRPNDRGFDESLVHGGGGVGQTPDSWGNDYFDDTYLRNGEPEKQTGYCTDIWFDNATKFIEKHQHDRFFCYIAPNAPHSPYNVDPKYAKPYLDQGVPQPMANFYGMIANIDENVGRLMGKLDELKLSNNTIVIFMTDNGSAAGLVRPRAQPGGKKAKAAAEEPKWTGFNAGMRDLKGSQYDGGHRVPCFIRWPGGEDGKYFRSGAQVATLTAHFDLLPTLFEMCMLGPADSNFKWDGRSLVPLLTERNDENWSPRTIVVHSQRVEHPEKWRKTAVMTDRWRLINGKELYEIQTDPGQALDVAARHPQVVEELQKQYDAWWADVSQGFEHYSRLILGSKEAEAVQLNCHDWHPGDDYIPWNQSGQGGVKTDPSANGWWAVDVERPGRYEFVLRSRPAGFEEPLKATRARVELGDSEAAVALQAETREAFLTLDLPAGPARLQTWLEGEGKARGAYYVQVRRVGDARK